MYTNAVNLVVMSPMLCPTLKLLHNEKLTPGGVYFVSVVITNFCAHGNITPLECVLISIRNIIFHEISTYYSAMLTVSHLSPDCNGQSAVNFRQARCIRSD